MRPALVTVDRDLCCRSGMCAIVAPGLLAQDPDGTPFVLAAAGQGLTSDEEQALVDEVVALCPVGALLPVRPTSRPEPAA